MRLLYYVYAREIACYLSDILLVRKFEHRTRKFGHPVRKFRHPVRKCSALILVTWGVEDGYSTRPDFELESVDAVRFLPRDPMEVKSREMKELRKQQTSWSSDALYATFDPVDLDAAAEKLLAIARRNKIAGSLYSMRLVLFFIDV